MIPEALSSNKPLVVFTLEASLNMIKSGSIRKQDYSHFQIYSIIELNLHLICFVFYGNFFS